jgi:hypothetical protein
VAYVKQSDNVDWWLGAADFVAVGVTEGACHISQVHLAIADHSFNLLARVPVTRPVSERVRAIHHGIARFCYGTVAQSGRICQRFVGSHTDPLDQ